MSDVRVSMFHEESKNRRMTPTEFADELVLCKIFQRPPRSFIKDKPFYPYVPPSDIYTVNFDLNAPQ